MKKKVDAIAAETRQIDVERSSLLAAEKTERDVATSAAREHKKVGTFGYQVFKKAGAYIAMIVDEAGDYLPGQALYTFEVVDENSPLPEWAKTGRGRALGLV